MNQKKTETWLAIIAVIAIIAAWFTGKALENADLLSTVKAKMPEISILEEIDKGTYRISGPENEDTGFLTIESSMGYGGPLLMAVAVDQKGRIFDLAVVGSKETPSYLDRVLDADFLDAMIGRSYQEDYSLGKEINAVSSATYSSRAILEASKKGSRFIAGKYLRFDLPKTEKPPVQFGGAEITLILLFAAGYFAHKKTFKYTKVVRWATMLTGLFVIGFYYNKPLTLSMINQLLLGYFPPLHSHLYWYLLLGGIFLVSTVDNKNPYCYWFCPFGAAQECLGALGGAKHRSAAKLKVFLKWNLRVITLLAIIAALLLRNPGITSYEVFGTLFKLTGSSWQFAILGIILTASIFIRRPCCSYLCPVKPILAHFTHIRFWLINQWKLK